MPDEIQFEDASGNVINELVFRRTVRGIPSPPVIFSARNLSEDKVFTGPIFIAPGDGPSYSQDLYIGDSTETWGRSVDVNINPGEVSELRTRVVPRSTPAGHPGKARIIADGDWSTA